MKRFNKTFEWRRVVIMLALIAFIGYSGAGAIVLTNPSVLRGGAGAQESGKVQTTTTALGTWHRGGLSGESPSGEEEVVYTTAIGNSGEITYTTAYGSPVDPASEGADAHDPVSISDMENMKKIRVLGSGKLILTKEDREDATVESEQEWMYQQNQSGLTIELKEPPHLEAEYRIVLPKNYAGELVIEGSFRGIDVTGEYSHLDVSTEYGNIRIEGAVQLFDVENNGGNVLMIGDFGSGEADASSGNVRLEGSVERGDFDVESGNIDLVLKTVKRGKVKIESESGNVRVSVPKGAVEACRFETQVARGNAALFGQQVQPESVTGDAGAATLFQIKTEAGNIVVEETETGN